ncbi:MAG: T9SS type A sorting domain-containing protein [Flavobacterium sp.]|jgi:hypothetical protein|uniref:T9SS type A sorting domain-containing protein n=1 Tax=Flavobacterium sp. TaxID=239 RepID=UPI0022C43D3C|nr:T9SS type A sorting domain-containing protein [Flavobacterium sp.]MCZ8168578.1 T9SS type A sorting domain-containing protein [Flavobacterium sp.]MCZ8297306.1 T9SS type A sorting domain-containing protein [Flavobacterium sp.]
MKKIYFMLFMLTGVTMMAQTIYSENMGTPSATTPIATNVFQNAAPIVYSGTADVRATTVSSGYTGASGSGNIFFTNTAGRDFLIEGINTSAFNTSTLQLSFGQYKSTTGANNELTVEVSTDGTTFTPLTYTRPTGAGTSNWALVTITTGIPSATNLRIRFIQTSTTAQFRLDDVRVFSFDPTCTVVPGTPTTACDATTFAIDTYTATIPFSGGGGGAYTVTSTVGTVGGDNPGSIADGNITVTGIPEGTGAIVTLVRNNCSYTVTITAPDCKPVSGLPLYDSMDYPVGSSLGATQFWANANTGDDVLAIADNLTYAGLTSNGNAAGLNGAGKELHKRFTATTVTEGALYASFIMKVTDFAATTDPSETAFAIITDGSATNFRGRIFIKRTGTTYQLGLTSGTSTTNYTTATYNLNDVLFVVVAYDFVGNSWKLWVNPTVAGFDGTQAPALTDTPAAAITTLGGFLFRQDTDALTPVITVDELRVSVTPNLLSVNNNAIEGLAVYPNPVKNGMFYINTAANDSKSVRVFDLVGKEVITTTTQDAVNVSGLNKGVYFVQITENGATAVKKLIIE